MTTTTNSLRIKAIDGGYRIMGRDATGTEIVADWADYATEADARDAMDALADDMANTEHEYRYATDSESGTITARGYESAKAKLAAMLSDEAIDDGAWGWVEDVDGTRHEIGSR